MAKVIVDLFPDHHSYLELFFGSGAVLFNKTRSNIETVNDLDDNVVNLFEWIKRDPQRLAHEIFWTPYARKIYDDSYALVPKDSLEKAVNFYILLNMGHGFRTNGEKVGWKNDIQGRERALYLIVKAKLEAVEAGISTVEREFFYDIVLPDGRTAGEWMAPQIEAAYQTGQMPAMLPMFGE